MKCQNSALKSLFLLSYRFYRFYVSTVTHTVSGRCLDHSSQCNKTSLHMQAVCHNSLASFRNKPSDVRSIIARINIVPPFHNPSCLSIAGYPMQLPLSQSFLPSSLSLSLAFFLNTPPISPNLNLETLPSLLPGLLGTPAGSIAC